MRQTTFILCLIVLNLFVNSQSFAQEKEISLADIWENRLFNQESVYGLRSMKDGEHYTTLEDKDGVQKINKYSYTSKALVETILASSELKAPAFENVKIEEYSFSADEQKILIATDQEQIYRHSTRETNYIFDRPSKELKLLSKGDKERYATFSPTGTKVAFVRKNNLYYKDLEEGKEVQITDDGKFNEVINGSTDWVYEEEFAFDKAFFWSPDGKQLAFYKFNETNVKEFSMDLYGTLYPAPYVFKYPKCGEENSTVEIYVYDLANEQANKIDLADYEYIPRIKWTSDPNTLSIQIMNRHQSKIDLIFHDTRENISTTVLTEKSDTYIDVTDNLTFLHDQKHFIWTSEKNGYNHIYLYDINGKEMQQITTGEWDVTAYKGYEESTKTIFYTSSEESALERHLYSISIDGSSKKKITKKAGWNESNFSSGFNYYINYHTDANTPNNVTVFNNKGKEIRVLKDNDWLKNLLKGYSLSKKEFFDFDLASGTKLNGWMIKPPKFDNKKKYPVLMYVYGGPGSQTVKNDWERNMMWFQMLAQKGYIIVSVDNRGTGARGAEFKKCTYKQLGKLETEDQISAARYLKGLNYVDGSRIGIWGWSYGGYMSSLCLFKGADDFKMAMAVAPVTNWRYYDSIYTERYMQTPQENPNGYDDNSPINFTRALKGNYLLVHGMADDNVHFQNSVELNESLIRQGKQFDFVIYPNRNHGIYGNNARMHLYTKMTQFVEENL